MKKPERPERKKVPVSRIIPGKIHWKCPDCNNSNTREFYSLMGMTPDQCAKCGIGVILTR